MCLCLGAQQFKSEHDSKERKAIIKECERIRELKDKYMDECQRLRQDRDDLDCRMMQQLTGISTNGHVQGS